MFKNTRHRYGTRNDCDMRYGRKWRPGYPGLKDPIEFTTCLQCKSMKTNFGVCQGGPPGISVGGTFKNPQNLDNSLRSSLFPEGYSLPRLVKSAWTRAFATTEEYTWLHDDVPSHMSAWPSERVCQPKKLYRYRKLQKRDFSPPLYTLHHGTHTWEHTYTKQRPQVD